MSAESEASMTPDTEKALLAAMRLTLRWIVDGAGEQTPYKEMRSVLATLEPKPDPKRGVEEILGSLLARLGYLGDDSGNWALADEALRLYREERERVEKVVAHFGDYQDARVALVDVRWCLKQLRRDAD